jgi:hypothetical protein
MSRRISFHFWPVGIRFFKPTRGGFCPVSVMLEGRANPIPSTAHANDVPTQRLKKLEALINHLLRKFWRFL